jgi:3-oxoacyl-[acyl-carrier protein] reductase
MRLEGKTCVVTGAASGIGRDIACVFAREGAELFVVDIDAAGGEDTADTIRKSGGKAQFISANVTKAADAENLAAAVQSKAGKLDLLVNCAGIFMKATPIEELSEEVWDRVFAVNVKSIFLMAKYLVPLMKKSGGGAIVSIASTVGFRPAPFRAPYMSSKGAVITLSKALALELAPAGIRVNYIAPGLTDTPIAKQFSADERQSIVGATPLARMIRPRDIAGTALFLASEDSSMLTGTGITVDGGLTI